MANSILEMVPLLKDGNQHQASVVADRSDWTIFEVPAHLRVQCPARYETKVLELGLHRRSLQNSLTELFKFELARIAHSKLATTNSSWDQFAHDVIGDVSKARRIYSASSDRFTDEQVRNLLVLDALFLVILFKFLNGGRFFWKEFEVLAGPLVEILTVIDKTDFFLIENQVPMYLLQSAIRKLCEIAEETRAVTVSDPPFKIEERVEVELETILKEAVLHLHPFRYPEITGNGSLKSKDRLNKHLLETYPFGPVEKSLINCRHLLDCLYTVICGHSLPFNVEPGVQLNLPLESIPSATRLQAVGICVVGSVPTLSHVVLSGSGYLRSAKLQLPRVELYDYSEVAFHNLALHEQKSSGGLCGDLRCYLQCMASLCVDVSDVHVLCEQGVINNHMGNDFISGMWDRSLRGVMTPFPSSKWVTCYRRIHGHRKASLKRWRGECWTLFFSSPWTLVSVVGAFMLLFLTAAQAWLTAFPPKGRRNG